MTRQLSPDTQQWLTTLVQATVKLAQSNKQLNQKLDTFDTKLDRFRATSDAKLDSFGAKIEAIADQIGKLTKSMTVFRLNLDEIKETTRQQTETAKIQAVAVEV